VFIQNSLKSQTETEITLIFKPNKNWKLLVHCLAFVWIITACLGAGKPWDQHKLKSYVEKKIRINSKVLRIKSKPLGSSGAAFLARLPSLRTLHTLTLYDTHIGDKGVRELAQSKYLIHLVHLNLGKNGISDQGVQDLIQSPLMAKLRTLNLYRNRVGNEGAITLARSKNLKRLDSLNLSFNLIGDPGALQITQSQGLENLKSLNMTGNPLGMSGKRECDKFDFKIIFRALKKEGLLQNLENRYSRDNGKFKSIHHCGWGNHFKSAAQRKPTPSIR